MTEPTLEMVLAGARSIGRTMRWENHNDRSRACWQAMIAASEGIEEPRPTGSGLDTGADDDQLSPLPK